MTRLGTFYDPQNPWCTVDQSGFRIRISTVYNTNETIPSTARFLKHKNQQVNKKVNIQI